MTTTVPVDHWVERAACRGRTHLFFPAPAERPQARDRRIAVALATCNTCSVIAECREAGHHETDGIWGGELKGEQS